MSENREERAEVGWYRTCGLRANLAPGGEALAPDIIVNLPEGLVERLHQTTDAWAGVIDEILDHLKATGQTVPREPREGDS
jgi:hypothetical protein